jgi:hypothetical protein
VITPQNRCSYVRVPKHLSMTPLVWGGRTRVRTCRSGGSGPSNPVLNTSPRRQGPLSDTTAIGAGRHAEQHLTPEADSQLRHARFPPVICRGWRQVLQ